MTLNTQHVYVCIYIYIYKYIHTVYFLGVTLLSYQVQKQQLLYNVILGRQHVSDNGDKKGLDVLTLQ